MFKFLAFQLKSVLCLMRQRESSSLLEPAVVSLTHSVGKLNFNSRKRIWRSAKAQSVSRYVDTSGNKTTVRVFIILQLFIQIVSVSSVWGPVAALRFKLDPIGAPVKRWTCSLCRAQSPSQLPACRSRYLFIVLRESCWCLQNQIGVWSPPMSSDSWNTECMPLGDLYDFGAKCVAVESNSGPLWHC